MTDYTSLIGKLEAWKDYDFHGDRQLSDEVLIADGWKCTPDAAWEGGVRWSVGLNPECSTGESGRPHPVLDLNTALAVVPPKHNVRILITPTMGAGAEIWPNGSELRFTAKAPMATIAVLIASLKAKQAMGAA